MANYKISQLPAYDQPVAADDLLAAVDTSFGTTKKLTTAQLFTDAGLTGLTTADTIDFNAAGLGGEVSWNNQEKTLDLVTGSDNVTVQLGQEVVLYARNNSGATLSDGNVVMISGSQGNNPTISLAQANTVENARKTIGVVTQIIPNNSNGFVTLIGKVRDLVLDNGTYSEGDVVYLSDTVAGGLTAVEPAIKVEVGHVLATSNGGNTNGVLEVQINNNAGTGGTVSSVSVTGGTGITSTGSPVTSSGTINVELDAATQTTLAEVATKAPIVDPTFTNDITVDGKIVTPEIITAVSGNTSEDLLISTPNGIGLVDGGNIKIEAGTGGNITLEATPLEGGGRVNILGDTIALNGVTNFGNTLSVNNSGVTIQNNYGLKFGSAGQELKDYKYGSFLPYLMIGANADQQSAYATRQGYYVKIGRSVTFNVNIRVTDFDAAFKTAASNLDIGIVGLPYSAQIGGGDGPDTMDVRVHPKRGWIQLGANALSGAVGSSPSGLVYFEKNVGQASSAAGDGWNFSRIKVGDFNVHPFNFTADGTKAFTFSISGTYITDDDV